MINIETGEIIKRPEGINISPTINPEKLNTFKFQMKKDILKFQVDNVKHRIINFTFSTFDIADNKFQVFLSFTSNQKNNWKYRITSVQFYNIELAEKYLDFYERIETLKEWNDTWMQTTLGDFPEIHYWWGKIVSPPINIKAERAALFAIYNYKALGIFD